MGNVKIKEFNTQLDMMTWINKVNEWFNLDDIIVSIFPDPMDNKYKVIYMDWIGIKEIK